MPSPSRFLSIPLPLLITGISGVAGYNALPYFQRRYPGQILGIRPTQTWQLIGPDILAVDTQDREVLFDLFRTYGFRSVLNCTGNCALKSCELDPAMAWRTNVVSAINIAAAARAFGARLVHLSSALVFSGKGTGNYVETDAVDPLTVSGRTMAEGERVVLTPFRRRRCCASRCPWGRASIATPAPSTGFNHVVATVDRPRCISMRCAPAHTPRISTASSSCFWPANNPVCSMRAARELWHFIRSLKSSIGSAATIRICSTAVRAATLARSRPALAT